MVINPVTMGKIQSDSYEKAYRLDRNNAPSDINKLSADEAPEEIGQNDEWDEIDTKSKAGPAKNSGQASLFVAPDRSCDNFRSKG